MTILTISTKPHDVMKNTLTFIKKHNFGYLLAWIPDSRYFQPVLGRKFHVESEFEIKNNKCLDPEGKNKEKTKCENFIF